MVWLLLVVLLAWALVVLAGPWLARSEDSRLRLTAAAVYLFGSAICHQRPDRSFHVDDVQLPVCARCAGLYVAAPFGVALALAGRVRRAARAPRAVLALAAAPTVATVVLEWTGLAAPSGLTRAVAAAPLAMAVAWLAAAAVRQDLR